jgi:hypothetical protein
VADLCVALLEGRAGACALDTTFEVKCTLPFSEPWQGVPDAPARDWGEVLGAAQLQQRVTGKTVGGVYSGRQPEPVPAQVAAAAARAGAAV